MDAQKLLNDLQDLGIDIHLTINKIPESTLVSVHDNKGNYLIKDFPPDDGDWNLREVYIRLHSLSPLSIIYRAVKSGQSYIQEVEEIKTGDNIVEVSTPIKDFIVNYNLMHSMWKDQLIGGESICKISTNSKGEIILEPVRSVQRIETNITILKTGDIFEVD